MYKKLIKSNVYFIMIDDFIVIFFDDVIETLFVIVHFKLILFVILHFNLIFFEIIHFKLFLFVIVHFKMVAAVKMVDFEFFFLNKYLLKSMMLIKFMLK